MEDATRVFIIWAIKEYLKKKSAMMICDGTLILSIIMAIGTFGLLDIM